MAKRERKEKKKTKCAFKYLTIWMKCKMKKVYEFKAH